MEKPSLVQKLLNLASDYCIRYFRNKTFNTSWIFVLLQKKNPKKLKLELQSERERSFREVIQ